MMITTQQALLAMRGPSGGYTQGLSGRDVSPELMSRALAVVAAAPDVREDRIAEARARLAQGVPNSRDLAEKIMCRVVCDSIR